MTTGTAQWAVAVGTSFTLILRFLRAVVLRFTFQVINSGSATKVDSPSIAHNFWSEVTSCAANHSVSLPSIYPSRSSLRSMRCLNLIGRSYGNHRWSLLGVPQYDM